jgi:peptide deformylase
MPLEIAILGEPILREKAKPVSMKEIANLTPLIDQMVETMYHAAGVGLAAPQVKVSKRFFVYDIGDGPGAIINPEIVRSEGEDLGVEGCLSIPRLHGEVMRAMTVEVKGLDRTGKPIRIEATEYLARVFQHEIDHLDGILFIDRADPASLHWITEEEEEGRVRKARATRARQVSPARSLRIGVDEVT